MTLSLTKTPSIIWRRPARFPTSRSTTTRTPIGILLLALVSAIFAGLMVPAPTRSQQQAGCTESNPACPPARAKVDLAFIIDRSGSMANSIDDVTEGPGRGQAYNIELEGVRSALLDPTVIPRDGSIAVTVVLFPVFFPGTSFGAAVMPFKEIDTAADAQSLADLVEKLKCAAVCDPVSTAPCPSGATFYEPAITDADDLLNQNHRTGARRVLLMSTDGKPSDLEMAKSAAAQARDKAARDGIVSELDVILTGVSTSELEASKANVNSIVFPAPPSDLPGAVFVIDRGVCNDRCAPPECGDFDRQVGEFAEFTRKVLRSDVSPLNLVVTTEEDTQPDTPLSGNRRSLRQAIEQANCNGGSVKITFDASVKNKTFRPFIPLPALRAPDIIIDGCDGPNCATSVTIAGPTDTARGEQHNDGLLIRSNHDVVRGLKIINFRRAGIAIDPVCQFDIVGHNRVEGNTLENNTLAGVLVLDPRPILSASAIQSVAVLGEHNIANTISRNDISGSATLIDLGGDGPTPNDPGDADQGPNTLLNFPDTLNVVATGGTLAISGQVNGPTADGAIVEVFAVKSYRVVSGNLVIDAVTFLTSAVAEANGSFNKTGVLASPSYALYTATVTDGDGNTSELMFETSATKPARPVAMLASPINFGDVPGNSPSPPQPVQIVNTGNAPLRVTSCAIAKCNGLGDDTFPFTVTNCPTAPINPGERATINVTFTPNACGPAADCLVLQTNDPYNPQPVSQLAGNGIGFPQAKITIEGGGTALEFEAIEATGKSRKLHKRPSRDFTIENIGCAQLNLTFRSILRIGGTVACTPDDSKLYSVTFPIGGTEFPFGPDQLFPIPQGGKMTFRVRFNPVIPPVTDAGSDCDPSPAKCPPSADKVLPAEIKSVIAFSHNGTGDKTVNLTGHVTTEVQLINANRDEPRKPPLVTLTKSADILEVTIFIFDANLDVNKAHYEFFDSAGRSVDVDNRDTDLALAIKQRVPQLCTGQSFKVIQRFSNANQHPEVARVSVTVTDGQITTAPVMSGAIGSLTGTTSIQAFRGPQSSALLMPIVKLSSSASSHARGEPRTRVRKEK
ncbi:MAG TPA: choice-of-anchor D domain-containing protein [Blastocatellia bacterium]|nr:choice-of-anchor D domain-containing protein [Blastocatellia bacterium]